MTMLILNPDVQAEIQNHRKTNGLDKYDEVWEGVTVVMPLPNREHQILVNFFCYAITTSFGSDS